MSLYRPMLLRRLAGLIVLLGAIVGHVGSVAQGMTVDDTVRSVRRVLERLPYYGVFDYIVFRVDGGTVYLAGFSFEGRLKADAEMASSARTASSKWPTRSSCCPPHRTTTESAGRRSTESMPMTSSRDMRLAACTESCKS